MRKPDVTRTSGSNCFSAKSIIEFCVVSFEQRHLKKHTTMLLELQIKTPHYCNACFDVARTKTNFSGGIQN